MKTMEIGHVIPALVTPFTEDGSVDAQRAGQLAKKLVDEGCDGILVGGTTGETPTLTNRERTALLTAVLEAVGDRAFVWAGTGTNGTDASLELSREAQRAGAHGLMLVAPYYNKPPQEGLYQHFRTIAETFPLPVMIYNVPSRTSVNISADTVARLAEIPNVAAIKEASGNLDQVSEIRRLAPNLTVLSGDDSLTLPILALGGQGVVSVVAHVAAGPIVEMVNAFREGDAARAEELHLKLFPLFKGLFVTTNPIPVKYALRLAGFDVGGYRLPMCEPGESDKAVIENAMRSLNLVAR